MVPGSKSSTFQPSDTVPAPSSPTVFITSDMVPGSKLPTFKLSDTVPGP
jgi:hypothetical protein